MRQKSKPLPEWQTQSADDQSVKEREAREAEDSRKKKEEDEEAFSYQVWRDGKLELETPREGEAIRLAKSINGKVIYCIEHCGLRQIYPETTPKTTA